MTTNGDYKSLYNANAEMHEAMEKVREAGLAKMSNEDLALYSLALDGQLESEMKLLTSLLASSKVTSERVKEKLREVAEKFDKVPTPPPEGKDELKCKQLKASLLDDNQAYLAASKSNAFSRKSAFSDYSHQLAAKYPFGVPPHDLLDRSMHDGSEDAQAANVQAESGGAPTNPHGGAVKRA